MLEWKQHIRARLEHLSCAGGREPDIVEEISQGLEARYEEALAASFIPARRAARVDPLAALRQE